MVRTLSTFGDREDPARIEADFDPALVREASASLTVPGGTGTVRYFRKAGRT